MVKGLKTGNAALVTAAAEEMHANASDVGGNQLTVDGGTYNTDGLTKLDVLGQGYQRGLYRHCFQQRCLKRVSQRLQLPLPAPPLRPAAAPATAAPATASTPPAAATSASLDTGAADTHHFSIQHHVDHHGHLWG